MPVTGDLAGAGPISSPIGSCRYVLLGTTLSSLDSGAGQTTVWHEADVIAVPEPSSIFLIRLASVTFRGFRRR